MRPVIYYRGRDFERDELKFASKYFTCVSSLLDINANDLVIGRYSMWPFYKDQERDINRIGAKLINSSKHHVYVSDLKNYVEDIKEYTPETWSRLQDIPEGGPFILKGGTNSKKFEWNTMMYASNKVEASIVHSKLLTDSLIGNQDIYIRRYVPLVTYMVGIKDLPVTKEFRFFVLNGKILSGAFYWSSHVDDLIEAKIPIPDVSEVPRAWLDSVLAKIGDSIPFYVIDVAQTEAGQWIVVELNDGQMSGLSENNPDVLYRNMAMALK